LVYVRWVDNVSACAVSCCVMLCRVCACRMKMGLLGAAVAWDAVQATSLVLMAYCCYRHTRGQQPSRCVNLLWGWGGGVRGCQPDCSTTVHPKASWSGPMPSLKVSRVECMGCKGRVCCCAHLSCGMIIRLPCHRCTWPGWTREAFQGWRSYTRMALPSCVMICE
jgi:hypothetical protein